MPDPPVPAELSPSGGYVADAGLLFSGDTLFRDSIGRTDMPGGSYQRILQSISGVLMALPDETRVLPGHMLETTIGAERHGNPFVREALQPGSA